MLPYYPSEVKNIQRHKRILSLIKKVETTACERYQPPLSSHRNLPQKEIPMSFMLKKVSFDAPNQSSGQPTAVQISTTQA